MSEYPVATIPKPRHARAKAKERLEDLKADPQKHKMVQRCLGLIETNPKHPGLSSHKYSVMKTLDGNDVWESYVENNAPAAWRVCWCYGPTIDQITIIDITEHP